MVVGMIVRTNPRGVEVRIVVRWMPPDERQAVIVSLAKVLAVTLLSLAALFVAPHALPLIAPIVGSLTGV